MKGKNGGLTRAAKIFGGKGFYIVLFICMAAVSITAWILTRSFNKAGKEISDSLEASISSAVEDNYSIYTLPEATPKLDNREAEPPATAIAEPSETVIAVPEQTEPVYAQEDERESEEAAAVLPEADDYAAEAPTSFIWPASGEVEREHSIEALLYDRTMADWRTHSGIDIASALGTKVASVAAGTVVSVINDPLYGTVVTIDHGGGLRSIYANLAAEPSARDGDHVGTGQIIGSVGNTSLAEAGEVTHLHFEMKLDGEPVDPLVYLPTR
ncbi:MAG: M23 family metallopeptidase [Clostridiales bacterium]|nr:M23 family metallopeptidase [Clostridiales bacterium]